MDRRKEFQETGEIVCAREKQWKQNVKGNERLVMKSEADGTERQDFAL